MNTANKNFGLRYQVARVLRLSVAAALPLIVSLAACGGTSDTTPICSASPTPQTADKFCAPTNAAAGQALRLQIREGCGGCTHRATKCEVVVSGQDVKLQLLGEVCELPPNTACPAVCSISTFDCAVPALAAGTYRVSTPAGPTTVATMVLDTTTAATTCTVPTP
jgi:hypothetical protein